MHAVVGGGIEGTKYTRKGRLLAGVSGAALALACCLPAPAMAGNYAARDEAELRARITAANGDPDPSATIVVTDNILMTLATALDAPTKPITIDTQGFTITGPSGTTSSAVSLLGGSGSFTLVGSFVGGDGVAGAAGGLGVRARVNTSTTNYGTIQGGNSQTSAGGAGVELGFGGAPVTFVNHGTIRGGVGPANGTGTAGAGIRLATSPPQIRSSTPASSRAAPERRRLS